MINFKSILDLWLKNKSLLSVRYSSQVVRHSNGSENILFARIVKCKRWVTEKGRAKYRDLWLPAKFEIFTIKNNNKNNNLIYEVINIFFLSIQLVVIVRRIFEHFHWGVIVSTRIRCRKFNFVTLRIYKKQKNESNTRR